MATVVMLALLPALMMLPEPFLKATGLRLSDRYSGGPVVQTIAHGAYQTRVHEMSFQALIGESRTGFIQVDWAPLTALPPSIEEEIDADGDGVADLRLTVDTAAAKSTLTPLAPWVLDLEGTYRLKDALMLRVRLRNPR
jgi:hypothetical protein